MIVKIRELHKTCHGTKVGLHKNQMIKNLQIACGTDGMKTIFLFF